MINDGIQISAPASHLSCPLNGVQINEVPKFLPDSPSKTDQAIQIVTPLTLPTCL